ncbi:unnamed protein product [Prunus armeniaca]
MKFFTRETREYWTSQKPKGKEGNIIKKTNKGNLLTSLSSHTIPVHIFQYNLQSEYDTLVVTLTQKLSLSDPLISLLALQAKPSDQLPWLPHLPSAVSSPKTSSPSPEKKNKKPADAKETKMY